MNNDEILNREGTEEDIERVTLPYIIGEHPDIGGRIVLAFDSTGLNLNNAKHHSFLDVICKSIATLMYAEANNISIENVEF